MTKGDKEDKQQAEVLIEGKGGGRIFFKTLF